MSSANIPIMAQEGPDIFAMINDIEEVQKSPDSGSKARLVDFEVSRIGDSGAVEDEGRSVDEQTDAPELEVLDTNEENRRAQEYLSTYLSSDSDRQLQPCTTSDSASHREDEDLLEISLLLQRPPSEWNFNKPDHIQDLAKVLQSVMKETGQASDEASGSPYTPALTTSSTPAVSPLVLPPSLSTGNFPSSDISEEPRLQALDLSDGPTIALSDFVGAFSDEQLDNNNSLHIQGVVPMTPPGLVQQTLLPTNLNPVNQSVHYPYFDPRMGFASPQFHVLPPFYNGIYPHPSLYPFSPSQMIPVLGFMPASNFIHGSHSNPAFIQGSSRDHSLHPGAYVPPMTRSGQKRKAHFSDPSPGPLKRRCGASSSTGISNPPSSLPPPPVSPVVGSNSHQKTKAGLYCLYKYCNEPTKIFQNPKDRNRHMGTHFYHRFACPVVDCSDLKTRGIKTYSRGESVKRHINDQGECTKHSPFKYLSGDYFEIREPFWKDIPWRNDLHIPPHNDPLWPQYCKAVSYSGQFVL